MEWFTNEGILGLGDFFKMKNEYKGKEKVSIETGRESRYYCQGIELRECSVLGLASFKDLK